MPCSCRVHVVLHVGIGDVRSDVALSLCWLSLSRPCRRRGRLHCTPTVQWPPSTVNPHTSARCRQACSAVQCSAYSANGTERALSLSVFALRRRGWFSLDKDLRASQSHKQHSPYAAVQRSAAQCSGQREAQQRRRAHFTVESESTLAAPKAALLSAQRSGRQCVTAITRDAYQRAKFWACYR